MTGNVCVMQRVKLEIPWAEFPVVTEWYYRLKSRPSFRPLLSDRVPGQPPVPHYGELDF